MKKLIFVLAVLLYVMFVSCERSETSEIQVQDSDLISTSYQVIEGKYVVQFEDQGLLKSAAVGEKVSPDLVVQTTRNIFDAVHLPFREPDFIYSSAIRGIAIAMTKSEAEILKQAEGVKGVYNDIMITLDLPSAFGKPVPAPAGEQIPWGIARIGGASNGTGKTAWIIDTGIDLDHPDLTVDASKGWNYITNTPLADDDNGHGTHCAGIVAARDNEIGVIGVAAGATVVPVKVLNRRGSGAYSTIIAGVDFVAANGSDGDAANMSLGGPKYQPLDDAIAELGGAGIKISLAAGNEAQDANNVSPARANGANIYTVSAMASNDRWASYSNFGNPPIDFCAPGSSIYSTYKGGTYATMSGTSMAAPHVCGILLISSTVKNDGYVKGDPDGKADPIAHK